MTTDSSVGSSRSDIAPGAATTVLPEAARGCVEGTYVGVFAGTMRALLGFVRTEVSGTLTLALAASGAGAADVRGTLDGRDADGHSLRARISATLDCRARRLERGVVTDGAYERSSAISFGRAASARLGGTVTGGYDPDPPSLSGTFALTSEGDGRSGSGSFTVRLDR